jgi:hypothetical protein
MSKTLSVKDALILQEEEDIRLLNGRTRRAISSTYGPKQRTKFRRKLPGKRSWKNKENQYRKLNMQMDDKQQKAFDKAQEVITKVNKRKQESYIKKMAKSANKHPLH